MAQESGIQTVLVPGRYRLRNQITLPYTILAVVVGVVAAFLITQVVVSSMEERFGNQLLEAGGQAADSVVRLEQRHLETWRLVAFTHGLSDAILAADHKSLSTIAGLAALNACLDAIDVMNSDGKPVFSAHRDPAAPLDCQRYSFEPWNIELGATGLVQKVAASTVDHLGDKYADLVPVDDQWILYTSGPIYSPSGDWAGSLLIGTYLDNAIRRFQADALADVTIYAADGQVLSTSFPVAEKDALAITPSIFSQVMENQGRLVLREPLEVAGDPYSQALGVFEVRSGQDMGVIGTALPVQWLLTAAVPARNWLIAVFGLAIAAILTMGNILATRIVTPIHHLVGASRRVAAGDLTPQVEAGSRDEIGTLAEVFNRMVLGLRERERVKDLFGRYMGEEIADEILKGNIEIGGRRVVATVLYSDIRDFTRLSERADPANLVASLQEYFTAMIAEIEVEQGLINKFGGDSILALFGAPVYRPDHAQQAVRSALQMLDRLVSLNQARVRRGEPPMRVGIGINSGDMIVGNMGTRERAEFTAIGDAVNVAARLSDMNKKAPIASIFISQETYRRLGDMRDALQVESLGDVVVKGKTEPVKVIAIVGRTVGYEKE